MKMLKKIKNEVKLPKVSVELAKLYEKAGFGTISNELPFICRVQYELQLRGIFTWVEVYSKGGNYTAHISIPDTKMVFVEDELASWEIAMEIALKEALKTLIQ